MRRLAASEPVSGSVRPKQPSASPEQSRGSHFCFCSSRAPLLDRARDQRGLHRDDGAGGGVGAADLLDDQAVADVVEAAAAVLLGDRRAEVADLAQLARQLAVETGRAVVLPDPRDDLLVGEFARRFGDQALLVGQLEVHLAPSRLSSFKALAPGSPRRPPAPRGCGGRAPRAGGCRRSRRPPGSRAWSRRGRPRRRRAGRRPARRPPRRASALTRRSRVIDSSTPTSSAGVRRPPCGETQKIAEVGGSSTVPSGVTSTASSAPCALRQPRRLHVGRVGERLDPVEDHARASR